MDVLFGQRIRHLVRINAGGQAGNDLLHACDMRVVEDIVVDEHVITKESELAIAVSIKQNFAT